MKEGTTMPLEVLLARTRSAREALHELVMRTRRDRVMWERSLRALPSSPRLTRSQREALQRMNAK